MCNFCLRLNVYPPKNEHDNGKSRFFHRRYIFKWLFFHCHVSFRGCICQDMSTTGFDIFKQQRNTSNRDVLHLKPCSCAGENQRPRIGVMGENLGALGSPNKNNLEIPAIPKRLGSWLVDGSENVACTS